MVSSMKGPSENSKQNYHMIQQCHFWVFIRSEKLTWKDLCTRPPCSRNIIIQEMSHGNKLSVHGWMDGWMDKENVVYTNTMKYYSTIKKKFCYLWQHGWIFRSLAKWNKAKKHKYCVTLMARSVQKVSSHALWKETFIEDTRNTVHRTVTPQSPY